MKKHLFINGKWEEASQYKKLRSPYSGEWIAEVAQANEQDADKAIQR